jgi:hypothetical protein
VADSGLSDEQLFGGFGKAEMTRRGIKNPQSI